MNTRQNHAKARPVALSLLKIRFPFPALASIAHRLSGVLLYLALLPLMSLAGLAMSSDEGFVRAGELLTHLLLAPLWALVFAAYVYHLCAGIRHLFMDVGIGEELRSGRSSAVLVLSAGVLCFFLALFYLLSR